MRTATRTHLAAKAFFRDLLDLCGGPKRASSLTGHPDSHLSAMGAAHVTDRWPRLDHVIDLEADCCQPVVTRFLADLSGFDLVPRDRRKAEDLPHVFASAIKEMTDVQVAYAQAIANGRIDQIERLDLERQANEAIARLQDFIMSLRGLG